MGLDPRTKLGSIFDQSHKLEKLKKKSVIVCDHSIFSWISLVKWTHIVSNHIIKIALGSSKTFLAQTLNNSLRDFSNINIILE